MDGASVLLIAPTEDAALGETKDAVFGDENERHEDEKPEMDIDEEEVGPGIGELGAEAGFRGAALGLCPGAVRGRPPLASDLRRVLQLQRFPLHR